MLLVDIPVAEIPYDKKDKTKISSKYTILLWSSGEIQSQIPLTP